MSTPSSARFSDTWWTEHAVALRRVAFALLERDDLAEDAVQDAFVAGLRRDPANVTRWPAWLAAVTRNKARRAQRGEARLHEVEQRSAREEAAPDAGQGLERAELMRIVATLVTELDPPYKETVELGFYSNLPPREIAKRLGVPVATVRTRMQRALAQLREGMERRAKGQARDWRLGLAALVERKSAAGPASHRRSPPLGSQPWVVATGVLALVVFGVLVATALYPLIQWLAAL